METFMMQSFGTFGNLAYMHTCSRINRRNVC